MCAHVCEHTQLVGSCTVIVTGRVIMEQEEEEEEEV